ncbi:MAG: type IV secretion system protein TraC [Candidatus Paracaedibacteraceae bacterium]|nr:type IV secretion system protein TraC [Candidatus Paracaedibacteraceae bacterium]
MLAKLGEKIFQSFGERDYGDAGQSSIREAYAQMAAFHKLCDLFPYDSYDETYSLFINDESVGFVLETPPLVGSSEEMQKEISNLFLNIFPEESGIQFMLWADPHIGDQCDDYCSARAGHGEIFEDMAKHTTDYLKSLVFNSKLSPFVLRNFRCIISFNIKTDKVNSFVLERTHQILTQVTSTLEMVGMSVKVWRPEHLINTLHGILHLDLEKTNAETYRWNPLQRLSDQLHDPSSNAVVKSKRLYLNDGKIEARVLKVMQYPYEWSLHAMKMLIGDEQRDLAQIPCPFILHYGIYIPKQETHKPKIMAKASYVERQAHSPIGKYLPSIQREAAELAFVRNELEKDGRIIYTQMSLVLLSTPDQITKAESIVTNYYASKEWKLKPVTFTEFPAFLMVMPLMWDQDRVDDILTLKMIKTTLSTEAENLLPIQGEWHGTKTPAMLLAGLNGQLFNWFPFDNNSGNFNCACIGKSGSGKSVKMQYKATSTLGLGGQVFILDVGRSFEKMCLAYKGQYIQFNSHSNICLNPFSSVPTDNSEETSDSLSALKLVLSLMAAPTKGLSDIENSILEEAMVSVWENQGTETNISDIASYLTSQPDSRSKDIGRMLFPYTKEGSYGRFFNGKSNVDLEDKLFVVEFSELESRPDLRSVVLQSMSLKITDRVYRSDRSYPQMLIVDEASDHLKNIHESKLFDTATRRFRKYQASIVIGTQTVEDFFQNPGAEAAFNNCEWQCYFNQKASAIELLKKNSKLILTPKQEALMKSLKTVHGKYSEVMINGPDGYAVGRLILDPFSLMLYSTKGQEYTLVKKLVEQGYSVNEAIQMLMDKAQQAA